MEEIKRKKINANTLMALMVIITIINVMATPAIPQYDKAQERASLRKAMLDAKLIHSTEQIYKSRNGSYWPQDTATHLIGDINANLNLNIDPKDLTYDCTGTGGSAVSCQMVSTNARIVLQIDQNLSSTNPSCTNLTLLAVCP